MFPDPAGLHARKGADLVAVNPDLSHGLVLSQPRRTNGRTSRFPRRGRAGEVPRRSPQSPALEAEMANTPEDRGIAAQIMSALIAKTDVATLLNEGRDQDKLEALWSRVLKMVTETK